MFVTSAATHTVHVYNKHGVKKKEIGKQGTGSLEFKSPCGITIIENVVYVADYSNHRIQNFSTEGMFVSMFGSYGTGKGELYCPEGLTIGPGGMVYISDLGNDRVVNML